MADILIRGVDIPKPNEGAYLMQVFYDGRTIVYHYAVNRNGFGTDSQKVIETKAVPLPEGHGRLIDTVDAIAQKVYAALDALDRGTDNDWARAALEEANQILDDYYKKKEVTQNEL